MLPFGLRLQQYIAAAWIDKILCHNRNYTLSWSKCHDQSCHWYRDTLLTLTTLDGVDESKPASAAHVILIVLKSSTRCKVPPRPSRLLCLPNGAVEFIVDVICQLYRLWSSGILYVWNIHVSWVLFSFSWTRGYITWLFSVGSSWRRSILNWISFSVGRSSSGPWFFISETVISCSHTAC